MPCPRIWWGGMPRRLVPGTSRFHGSVVPEMLREYPPDANAAAEQALREALDAAWADYQKAVQTDKPEASLRAGTAQVR